MREKITTKTEKKDSRKQNFTTKTIGARETLRKKSGVKKTLKRQNFTKKNGTTQKKEKNRLQGLRKSTEKKTEKRQPHIMPYIMLCEEVI